jgi:ABC-type transport system involved in multi-copper enzyme maturation permease subunit
MTEARVMVGAAVIAGVVLVYILGIGPGPLAPWTGFAVLCGYAVLAMGLALFLLRRRDA